MASGAESRRKNGAVDVYRRQRRSLARRNAAAFLLERYDDRNPVRGSREKHGFADLWDEEAQERVRNP